MGRGQDLLDAARKGDERSVEKILIQITKRSGPFTSLSLRRGAGVNVQDDNGYTPLHHACLQGHKQIVSLLLNVDANPCVIDKMGATPLHLASWKGDAEIVAMLLTHTNPAVDVNQLTLDQETALIMAAQYGFLSVVAQLLARGADVSIRNVKGDSALDLAAQYGRLSTVKHLIQVEPSLIHPYKYPNWRNHKFCTTPLHRASKNGHKDVVQVLLKAGIDPNIRTNSGTPLHEAACFGKAAVVEVLLRAGADLRATDSRDKTVEDLLADYSEEVTRQVRWAIQVHKNKGRNNYESEDDVPPFPVDCSPTSYHGPVVLYDNITDPVLSNACNVAITNTNVNVPNADLTVNVQNPNTAEMKTYQGHRMRSFTYTNTRTSEAERLTRLIKYNLYRNPEKNVAQATIYENLSHPELMPFKYNSSPNSPNLNVFRKKKPKPSPKPLLHNNNQQVNNNESELIYEFADYASCNRSEINNIYNNEDLNRNANTNENAIYENISDDDKAIINSYEKVDDEFYVDINSSNRQFQRFLNVPSSGHKQDANPTLYVDMSGPSKESKQETESPFPYVAFHLRGDVGCKYTQEDTYFTFYSLNSDKTTDAYPFEERKQKFERLPCYCRGAVSGERISEEIFYSCENLDKVNEKYQRHRSNTEHRRRDVFKKKFNKLTQRLMDIV